MKAHVSALTFDPDGHITIDLLPKTDRGELRRRVSRVATLDGGVAVNNFGFTDADRTLRLHYRRSQRVDEGLSRLCRLYAFVRVVMHDGVYRAAIDSHAL
ncbi:hypothetical protein RZS08_04335, partial [Arthrospira platensis SPKY1]|nr:hypothetical protein [Arthrospira platensis SPKY1]